MKKIKDITFESDLQLSSSKAVYPLIKHFDILIAFLATVGVINVFISSFMIEIQNGLITSAIICFTLLFSFMFKKIKYLKYIFFGSLLIYGSALYMFYGIIKKGFMITWNIVAEIITNNSNFNLLFFENISLDNEIFSISIFLIFIIFIISAIISYSVIYKPKILLLLFITVPILELGLYFANMPSYFYLSLLIISWISVIGMRTIKNRTKTSKSKLQFKKRRNKHTFLVKGNNRVITASVGIIIALITGIIFIMTILVYPPSTYEKSDDMLEVQADIQNYLDKFTLDKFINDLMGIGHGGVNGGKLGNIGRIVYTNETALQVTAPYFGENIYLKGYTGCEYAGNSWVDVPADIYGKYLKNDYGINGFNINARMIAMLSSSSNTDITENFMGITSIKNIGANNEYIYMPYSSMFTEGIGSVSMDYKKESSLHARYGQGEYTFSNYPNLVALNKVEEIKNEIIYQEEYIQKAIGSEIVFNSGDESSTESKNTSIFSEEQNYTDFANEAYTRLPEEGLEEIKNKYAGRYKETKDLSSCVEEAMNAVTDGISYDLSPGKLPKGKDFVEYFLYENKKGYCTHFASAAAVILRAMGVPTRYVEGYVIKPDDADNAIDTIRGEITRSKFTPVTFNQSNNSTSTIEVPRRTENNNTIKEADGGTENQINITQDVPVNGEVSSKNGSYIEEEPEKIECDIKTMNIKDTNAHAWVEVYVDKIGWIPIDVTPGGNDNNTSTTNNQTEKKKEPTTPSNGENIDNTKKPEEVVKNDNTIDNTQSTQSVDSIMVKTVKGIMIMVGIILVAGLIITLRHNIITSKRKKTFSSDDYNKNVHNIYKYLMEIYKYSLINNKDNLQVFEYVKFVESKYPFIKEGEFAGIINILFKADFSQHKISLEELEAVSNFTNKFNDEIYSTLSKIQKINYTYIKNLR